MFKKRTLIYLKIGYRVEDGGEERRSTEAGQGREVESRGGGERR